MPLVTSQAKMPTSTDVVQKESLPTAQKRSSVAITGVKDQMGVVLDQSLETEKEYMCPDFIIENDKGVFIDLDSLIAPESFFKFTHDIFTAWYYFTDIQYETIMTIIYDYPKTERHRKRAEELGKPLVVQIASNIKKFDEKRLLLYKTPLINNERTKAAYVFEFSDTEGSGEKDVTIGQDIHIDELIAVMWNKNIRFRLDFKTIQAVIWEKKSRRCIIAKQRDPAWWEPAKMKPMISFDIDRGIRGADGAEKTEKVDIHVNAQSHVEVKEDTILYQMIPQVDGNPGWTLSGDLINPPKIPSFPIKFYVGEGVRIEIRDGAECLVADRDGFPQNDMVSLRRGEKMISRLAKVHVHTQKTLKGINKHTGKMFTENDIISKGDIDRDVGIRDMPGEKDKLGARNVTAHRNVEANIYALENVLVYGGVFGGIATGRTPTSMSQKIRLVQKGRIVSDSGNITIKERISNAYLEAKQGVVHVWNINNSIIKAKRVVVDGDIVNCIVMADEIITKKEMAGCKIISGKNMSILESTHAKHAENTMSLFSVDLQASIEEKQNLLNKEEIGVEKIENDIYTILMSRSLVIEKSVDEKRKWFHLMVALMDVFTDQGKLKQEKYQVYVPPIQKYITVLRILNQNDSWKKLRKYYISIKQLSGEIAQETTAMEWAQKDLHIEIGDIQCHTHIHWIKFPQNKRLLDLTSEELDAITASLNKPNTTVPYKLEKIPSPTKWSFEWRPV